MRFRIETKKWVFCATSLKEPQPEKNEPVYINWEVRFIIEKKNDFSVRQAWRSLNRRKTKCREEGVYADGAIGRILEMRSHVEFLIGFLIWNLYFNLKAENIPSYFHIKNSFSLGMPSIYIYTPKDRGWNTLFIDWNGETKNTCIFDRVSEKSFT